MTLDILQVELGEILGDNAMIKGMDSVFEKTPSGNTLVLSIHELLLNTEIIIHTKFIFPVNDEETETTSNYFRYLYDINCMYKQINYSDTEDLNKKITNILDMNKFGDDIKLLSDFIEAPSMFINDYFKKNNISEYSIHDFIYFPKEKIIPCREMSFDFIITINNNIKMNLNILKVDSNTYITLFRYNNIVKTFEINSLLNLHQFIGNKIIDILTN